ncbi:hypothetical protein L2E82_36427 [Cichorium intybus]|uniref:Uncharacterized protein n=1 Tax=Cichorium intybus TaxID=13427 RepID=A0ACB9BRV1_CICIN|nr:hypothetical protein L2E82_36427 [Cichorium intybus]
MELKLDRIPGFTGIYPQKKLESSCLLKEVVIPKLERLHIDQMDNLKEIWPCEFSMTEEVKLREIEVRNCDNLVNMFPCNPMYLLHHLEELIVKECGSIEVLFNIDLDSICEIGEPRSSSSLRIIKLQELGKLREVWRIKGAGDSRLLIQGFQAVESLWIRGCKRFRNVFTPITTNFDLGALMDILISDCGENQRNNELAEGRQKQEQINIQSKEEMSHVGDSSSKVVFQSSLVNSFHNLRVLEVSSCEEVEVVFDIESPKSRELMINHDDQQKLLPYLTNLEIRFMERMSHIWKCDWNKFLILQKQQSESPFHSLTTIRLSGCKSIKYLFSPLMAKLLSNLKKVYIFDCDGIEEVVSNRDDEDKETTTCISTSSHTSTILFPCLDSLALDRLPHLKCISGCHGSADGGNNELISFNNTTTISAFVDHQLKHSQILCTRKPETARSVENK